MGVEAAVQACVVRHKAFFKNITAFEGHYKQHNAALKLLRQKCQDDNILSGYAVSNTYKTAVAAIIHPPGEDVWFNEDDTREW